MKNSSLPVQRFSPNPKNMRFASRRSLSRRSLMPLVVSVLMLSLLALQGTPVSATRVVVSTSHLAVGFTFPGSAHPGETIVVGAAVTAQSNARIVSFSIDIFAYVSGQLVRLASQTIMADKTVQTGDNWHASLVVVIPANVQPGPLAGRLAEVWQATQNYRITQLQNYYSNYYPSNYVGSLYSTSDCSLYQYNGYYGNAYYNYGYQNYYNQYYGYPYYDYYNSPYYGTYTYNRQAYANYPTRNTAFWTPTDTRYVYEPTYVCQPAPYYGLNYAPNYDANYASQVSQRTFTLTSITYY